MSSTLYRWIYFETNLLGDPETEFQITVNEAVDLGSVDYMEAFEADSTQGDGIYHRCQASNDGYLTIEALFEGAPESVNLTLYDQNETPIATGVVTAEGKRIDFNVSAGQTYYFRIAGTNTSVDWRLANLVELDGDQVTIVGSNAQDEFVFTPTGGSYQIDINNISYPFLPTEVTSMVFSGGVNHDHIVFHDSPDDDLFEVAGEQATLTLDDGCEINAMLNTFCEVEVFSTAGGNDTADLHTSVDGNDRVTIDAVDDSVHLYNSTSDSGADFDLMAHQFKSISVYSEGGTDRGILYDSDGDECLEVMPAENRRVSLYNDGTMNGDDFAWHLFGITSTIYASNGGNDTAFLHDSPENDRLNIYEDTWNGEKVRKATLTTSGMYALSCTAIGFESLEAYADHGGTDTATLYDSSGDDVAVVTPSEGSVRLYNDPTMSGNDFSDTVWGFENITCDANHSLSNDTAIFYDTAQDDTFISSAINNDHTVNYINSPTSNTIAHNFEQVAIELGEGGEDFCGLYDSSGNDHFEAGYDSFGLVWDAGTTSLAINHLDAGDTVCAQNGNGGIDTENVADPILYTYDNTRLIGLSLDENPHLACDGLDYVLTLGEVTGTDGRTIDGYTVDWGDGTIPQYIPAAELPANRQLSHVYDASIASYPTILVEVTLDGGTYSLLASHDIWVLDDPLIVTTLEDETDFAIDDVSLREALYFANLRPGSDTIGFDPSLSGSIMLDGTELGIADDVTIEGIGAESITIDADGDSRVFYITNDITVQISDLTITGGDEEFGGGIYVDYASVLTLSNVTVAENQSWNVGGGIFIDATTQLFVLDSLITGNSAGGCEGGWGGGIYTEWDSETILSHSVISNNEVGGFNAYGGGLCLSGDVAVINSVISGNETIGYNGYGGGIFFQDGTLAVTNSTIVENVTNNGGGGGIGIFGEEFCEITINNSIVTMNTADEYPDVEGPLTPGSGNNLIGVNPCFLVPGEYRPSPNSPAVDAGDNAAAAGIDYDIDGNARIINGVVDIGAYEYTETFLVSTSLDENDGNYAYGDLSLREALALANGHAGEETILFDPSVTMITLGGTELNITDDVTIEGPGDESLTIDAEWDSRVFYINDGMTATISGMTIANGAWENEGGGIFVGDGSTLNLRGATLTGNESWSGMGGGIYGYDFSTISIADSNISDNYALVGGGVFGGYYSTITVDHSTISQNWADEGGGVFADVDSSVMISDSIFSDNYAYMGGGIAVYDYTELTVTNSLICDNGADDEGGAIFAGYYGTSVTLTNTTITNNYSVWATGGVYLDPQEYHSLTVNNSIIALNGGVDLEPTWFLTGDNNLIGVDPGFVGGGDYHLTEGSPAINAGNNEEAAGIDYDLDGKSRVIYEVVDIGAYEYDSEVLFVTTSDDEDDGDYSSDDLSLREALDLANERDGEQTIKFNPSISLITLGGTELSITDDVTIEGLGADLLTIDAYGDSRVFHVTTSGVTATISGMTITNGFAEDYGGGIYAVGDLNVTDLVLSGNTVEGSAFVCGGGIHTDGDLTVTDSLISDNTITGSNSAYGGGISTYGEMTVNNSVISDNVVAGSGGGGGIYLGDGEITVVHTTIADNVAINGKGGGISGNCGYVGVYNSIVAQNEAPYYENFDYDLFLMPDEYATSLIGGDPSFVGNGDYHLLPDSCAISGGVDLFDKGIFAPEITHDLDGNPRIIYGAPDIGAYEYDGDVLIVWSSFDHGGSYYWPCNLSLRQALTLADEHDGVETIQFASRVNQITLNGTELNVDSDVMIEGPGAESLTINANLGSRAFNVASGVTAEISGMTITNGFVEDRGGGILCNSGSHLTIEDAVISGNRVEGSSNIAGGGVFAWGDLTVIDSVVSNNVVEGSAHASGGGIGVYGDLTVAYSIISDNTVTGTYTNGGGIYTLVDGTIVNSVIADNAVTGIGGGAGIYLGDAEVTIAYSTIVDNEALNGNGGGIGGNWAYVMMFNTIVAQNAAQSYPDVHAYYLMLDEIGCLIGGDPGFVAAGDYHLAPDSPAINAGENDLNEDLPVEVDYDLDGNPRIIYDTVDIGAYEYTIIGDTNRNGMVGQLDVTTVATNLYYGMSSGAVWADGDFDSDGAVTDNDLYLLALHWEDYYSDPIQAEIPDPAVDQVFTDYGYDTQDPNDDITPEDEDWDYFLNDLYEALGIIA
ncbi:MAG: right-handed parallel beta-helix repeat-containing protein [Planctomycetia bacterium]